MKHCPSKFRRRFKLISPSLDSLSLYLQRIHFQTPKSSRTTAKRELRKMSELPMQNTSSSLTLSRMAKNQGSAVTGSDSTPKKKICCACPDTKKLRDECVVEHGEDACSKWIEAHLRCLRAEGFKV